MSFHLEGPWLNTTGRKKGKHKFHSADQAKNSRALQADWQALLKKWGIEQQQKKQNNGLRSPEYKPPKLDYRGIDEPKIPSHNNGADGAIAAKLPTKVYTGTKLKGIATMHKSNAVPIFSVEEAVEIATMRR